MCLYRLTGGLTQMDPSPKKASKEMNRGTGQLGLEGITLIKSRKERAVYKSPDGAYQGTRSHSTPKQESKSPAKRMEVD